jgi:ribosome-associated toxin RatA of RatAB toxin-antitoxin module
VNAAVHPKEATMFSALAVALLAANVSAAPPAVHEERKDGVYVVDGNFSVPAPIDAAQAYAVLADYGHLKDFISSIHKSEVRGRSPRGAVVEQEATGKWLLFSRTVSVLLDIREIPDQSIVFHDVSHKDFTKYQGSWTVHAVGGGVVVDYHLEAAPSASIPSFVIEKVIVDDASGLLTQLRSEIIRRAAVR